MTTDPPKRSAVTRGGGPGGIAVVLVCSAAFGAAASVLHGAGGGSRAAIGNLSAPWLLLPFAAGAWAARGNVVRGALIGLLASVVGLLGFYAMNVQVLNLEPTRPFISRLVFAIQSGTLFVKLGAFTGLIFGSLGAAWQRAHQTRILVFLALLAMLEPFAQVMYFGSRSFGANGAFSANAVAWIPEFAIGAASLVWIATRRRQPR